jgi:hypothetical protein
MGNKISDIFHRMTEWLSGLRSIFSGNWVKPAVILSACVIFVAGSFMVWTNVLSPEARKSREDGEKITEFFSGLQAAEERQRQDTYGGETPEETLQLFIAALESGDLELASKYFKLTVQGEEDPKWRVGLEQARGSGNINRLVNDLKKATRTNYSESLGSCTLSVFENGNDIGSVLLSRNIFSNLWKISGM